MRKIWIAVICLTGLTPALFGCAESPTPVEARLGFDFAQINGVTTDHASTGGVGWVDFDNDGDLDVFITNQQDQNNLMFRNGGCGGHRLRVKLVGSAGNPGGIGVRVLVTTESGAQMRDVTTQMGFRGQSDLSPHFGLGQYDHATRIEVRWPSGKVSTLERVSADQVVEITESRPIP